MYKCWQMLGDVLVFKTTDTRVWSEISKLDHTRLMATYFYYGRLHAKQYMSIDPKSTKKILSLVDWETVTD